MQLFKKTLNAFKMFVAENKLELAFPTCLGKCVEFSLRQSASDNIKFEPPEINFH